MKILKRTLSVMMVLAMMVSMFVLPTSAANAPATLTLTAEQTASSPDVYKVTVSTQCEYTLQNMNMVLAFDKTAFKLIRNTGVADTTCTNANGYKKLGDMLDTNCYDGSVDHPVFGAEVDQFNEEYGYAYGVGKGSFTFQKSPASAAYGDIDQSKYQAILFDWTMGLDDNCLLFDCEEKTDVFCFYLQRLDTAADGDYTVGFITGGKTPILLYDPDDTIDSLTAGQGVKGDVTVNNATIKLTTPSPVYKKSSQIRYNSAETNGEGSANFDVRTRAAMTAADFAKYCTYNAETKETNITKVGFVYADSSVGLTLDNAAKVIGGTAVAGYVDVPVEHIQLKDGEYIWTCLITDADYNDAVDSVGYIVAGGKTFYFDAVSATDFSELYDTWSSKIPA